MPLFIVRQAYEGWRNDRFSRPPSLAHLSSSSVIFLAAALYLVSLAFPALETKDFGISLEITLFLLLTGTLASSQEDVLSPLFAVMAVVAALHALPEIASWLSRAATLSSIDGYSLSGLRLGEHLAATLATLYSIFLVACVRHFVARHDSALATTDPGGVGFDLAMRRHPHATRSGYLAALGGIVAVLSCSSRVMRSTALAVTLILVMVVITVPAFREAMWLRGDSYRFEAWNHYLQIAEERPLLGFGSVDLAFEAKDGYLIKHAHNLILSAQVRGGVLGAVAMLTMLFGGLYYAARYAKLTGNALPLGIMVTLALAGLFDYDIRAQRFYHLQSLFFWLPIGICIGTELCVRRRNALSLQKSPSDGD